jgi:thioesterase domain-containing protein
VRTLGHDVVEAPLFDRESLRDYVAELSGQIADGNKVVIIGWSFGGLIAQHLCKTLIERGIEVAGVILVASNQNSLLGWLTPIKQTALAVVRQFGFTNTVGLYLGWRGLMKIGDELRQNNESAALRSAVAYVTAGAKVAQDALLQVRVLQFVPSGDSIIPIAVQRRAGKCLNAEMINVQNTDHFSILGSQETLRLIAEFLQKIQGGP